MRLFSCSDAYKLYEGSMLDLPSVINDGSIDCVVTDPPYELNFMNKGWDNSGIAFQVDTWKKMYQLLKPGGYLLAFGGSRTFHRIAVAIEDAGFEIRDTIMWLYGSGFPKSMNIGLAIDKRNGVESEIIGTCKSGDASTHTRCMHSQTKSGKDVFGGVYEIKKSTNEWGGYGTALKPAFEPIIVARKPCEGSCIDNVIKYGVGGINIDECRVPANPGEYDIRHYTNEDCFQNIKPKESKFQVKPQPEGRFPANIILTYDDTDYEEVCGGFPNSGSGNGGAPYNYSGREYNNRDTSMFNGDKPQACSNYNDNGSASRYFYCAKASKKDRDEGLDKFIEKFPASDEFRPNHMEKALQGNDGTPYGRWQPRKNIHPTVKPTGLMQYLVRLVAPNGATILDPFNGSGSTGKAVMFENKERDAEYKYIGCDLSEEYLSISKARIEYAMSDYVCDNSDIVAQTDTHTSKKTDLW